MFSIEFRRDVNKDISVRGRGHKVEAIGQGRSVSRPRPVFCPRGRCRSEELINIPGIPWLTILYRVGQKTGATLFQGLQL